MTVNPPPDEESGGQAFDPDQPGTPPAGRVPPYVPPAETPSAWSAPPPNHGAAPTPPAASGGPGYGRPGPGFDAKSVSPLDWGILGAGVLAFIFSFLSYYTASVEIGGFHVSGDEDAWHGFFGWAAALLAIAGSVILAIELLSPRSRVPSLTRSATLLLYSIAGLFVIIAGFVFPESVPRGISTGRGVGYWLSLIVILAGAALAFVRLRATGGKLPWEKSGGQGPGY